VLAALVLASSGASLFVGWASGGATAGAASPRLLQVEPAVVDFPDTVLGTQTETSAILTNEGTSTDPIDLLLGGVSSSGPGADDYQVLSGSDCPHPQESGGDPSAVIILMPGQSCGLDLYFTPGALGDRSATMSIQGSEDASGFAVALHGTGSFGYYEVDQRGTVVHLGDGAYYGDVSGAPLNRLIVAVAQTGDNGGYCLVAADGGMFNFGDAPFLGSATDLGLDRVVGMATNA
jgi:hypothetical protein